MAQDARSARRGPRFQTPRPGYDASDYASASAALSTGGRLSASGTVSTNAAAGFPALHLYTMDQARLYAGLGFVAIGTVIHADDGRVSDLMVWRPSRSGAV